MRALVTGGAGFIGSHLAELLVDKGHEVLVLDNLVSGRWGNLTRVVCKDKLKLIEADIRDRNSLEPLFRDIDWVFHLAGMADIVPSIEAPQKYFETNVVGTLNVLECSRSCNVKKVIYAASSSSYGIPNAYPTPETCAISPQYPYALTKAMGEDLVLHWSKVYRMDALSLRLFNVFGTRSRTTGAYGAVFGVFLAQKLNGRPFTVVGDGTQTRDFTYVTDVARAFLAAAESRISGIAMNVGSGNHHSINRLVGLLGGEVEYIPKRPGEPDCTYADISLIKSHLNWQPNISFERGVLEMLANIDDWKDAPLWDSESIRRATEVWFRSLAGSEEEKI